MPETTETAVRAALFAMQDPAYRTFQSGLIPTLPRERIIGVRMPALRRYAAAFSRTPQAAEFLRLLPHSFYEENNLHALLLERIPDFDRAVAGTDAFLSFVDNWATCDLLAPRAFAGAPAGLLPQVRRWLASGQTYTVRFGIGVLMRHYLGERFSPEYPAAVARLCGEEYYVNMMIAWYFATALAFQYRAVLPYLTDRRLPTWVHRMTIRKAVESRRLTPGQKAELRACR